jgi:hypothetical protein
VPFKQADPAHKWRLRTPTRPPSGEAGHPGQAAPIVPYGRWSRPVVRPAILAAVLR